MICSQCGRELREGQAFCPQCGAPVNAPAQPAPDPAAQSGYAQFQPVPAATKSSLTADGSWFAFAAVLGGWLVSYVLSLLISLVTRNMFYYGFAYSLVSGVGYLITGLVIPLAACILLYFAAFSKKDPVERGAKLALAFVPFAAIHVGSQLQSLILGLLGGIFNNIGNAWYIVISIVLGLLFHAAAAVGAFFLVRVLQKKTDAFRNGTNG